MYVAGGPVGGDLAITSGGAYTASGSAAWLALVKARGQTGALAATPTDVGPWGGFIVFDNATNWDFTAADPGPAQYDFDSVARHELLHLLGFGLGDPAFERLVNGGSFVGPEAEAADGGQPVPMQAGDKHWAAGVTSGRQAAIMVPTIPTGVARRITPLD